MADLRPGQIEIKVASTDFDVTETVLDYLTRLLEKFPWEVVGQSRITEVKSDYEQPKAFAYFTIVRKEQPHDADQ